MAEDNENQQGKHGDIGSASIIPFNDITNSDNLI
jgi:hypothetical protein